MVVILVMLVEGQQTNKQTNTCDFIVNSDGRVIIISKFHSFVFLSLSLSGVHRGARGGP